MHSSHLLLLLQPLLLLALLLFHLAVGLLALVSDDYRSNALTADNADGITTFVNGTVGGHAVLPCEVPRSMVKDPSFNVIWMKGKVTLTLKTKHLLNPRMTIVPTDIHTHHKFDLRIGELEKSDSALYKCVATITGHGYFTRNISLVVYEPPTIVDDQSANYYKTINENTAYSMECRAIGVPPPTVRWYKKVDQRNRDKIYLGQGSVYKIENVSRNCDGTFICVAQNGIEPSATKQFFLTVNYRPQVQVLNKEILQRRGHTSMVMCVINANPLQEFYWERRGVKLKVTSGHSCGPPGPVQKYCLDIYTPTNQKSVVRLNLSVNNLTADDYGEYYCVAKSKFGTVRKVAMIIERQDELTEKEQQQRQQQSSTRTPFRGLSEPHNSPAVEEASSGQSRSLTSQSLDLNGANFASVSMLTLAISVAVTTELAKIG